MTPAKLVSEFLRWAEKMLAAGTAANYRRHLEAFVKAVDVDQVELLKPHHLMSWGETWHQIQAVQRCWAWALEDAELVDRNPFKRVKRPPLGQRHRTLRRPELVKLLRGSARDFRQVLVAARETIARPQELRAMAWEHIEHDPHRGKLADELRAGRAAFVLEEFKGRKRRSDPTAVRVIPITPRLGRLLARLLRSGSSPTGRIFRNAKGTPWSKEAVRLRMQRLRNRVGLVADHRGENVCLYTLRHTGGTEAAAAGVRDRVLAELMGHTSTRTTARYQHLDRQHIAAAMQTVADFRQKRRTG